MCLKLSKWFFLLLIVSLPLVRPFNLFLFDLQVPYTDLIFLLAFAFWVLALILRQTSMRSDRLFIFVGLYALAFTISTIFSLDSKTSFFKLLGEYYLFALCFLTFNLCRDLKFLKQIGFAWLTGTVVTIIASLVGILIFYLGLKTQSDNYLLSHLGSLPSGDYPRIRALFENANMMCNFLNVSIVFAFLAERLGWLKRTPARIVQLGVIAASLFTISPGLGGIALSTGLWYWTLFSNKSRRPFARSALLSGAVFAAVFFVAVLVSPDTQNTEQEIRLPFTNTTIEVSVRVLVWENTVGTFVKHPWVGKGTGTNVAEVKYQAMSGDNQILLEAHNVWLNVLGQTGLIGIAALLLMTAYLLSLCRFKARADTDVQYVRIALSCAFVGAFLYQGLAGSFEDARHLWILFGLMAAFSGSEINASASDISEASKAP